MAISASAGVLAVLIGLVPGWAFAEDAPAAAPRAASRARAAHVSADPRAGAVMPGFETLADGTSRLFVELSKPVAYDTKAARGSVTYVLKGTRVLRRNNTNPLVTVHFNTPVTTARLVPHGRDLWFVIDLRANVQPVVSMDAGKDGGAVMRIELPKGDYLPASVPPPASAAQTASSAASPSSSPPTADAPAR